MERPGTQSDKYDFTQEGGIWHIEGQYFLPDDEPMFLLRGKDEGTLPAIDSYIDRTESILESTSDDDVRMAARAHLNGARSVARRIKEWQKDNPEKVGVGCTTAKSRID